LCLPAFAGGEGDVRVPKFFFHLHTSVVALDAGGLELPTSEAATNEAVKIAREVASAEVREGHLGLNHRVEVEDTYGAEVATVHFKDAIDIHP